MKRLIAGTILLLLLTLPVSVAIWAQAAHSITVAWSYVQGTDPAVGFNVYRATVTAGPYTKVSTTVLAITTLSFSDTVGVGGTKYFYVVDAQDMAGVHSAYSGEASATFIATSPNVPAGITATAH